MPQEFVAQRVDIAFSTERFVALGALGPLVHHVPGLAVERCAVGVGLDEVLLDLRADGLQQETCVPDDGIGPQNRVPGLDQVPHAERRQQCDRHGRQQPPVTDHQTRAAPAVPRPPRQRRRSAASPPREGIARRVRSRVNAREAAVLRSLMIGTCVTAVPQTFEEARTAWVMVSVCPTVRVSPRRR